MRNKVKKTKKYSKKQVIAFANTFNEALNHKMDQLFAIQIAAIKIKFGQEKELRDLLSNPNDEIEKLIRWTVIPSGLLEHLRLDHLNEPQWEASRVKFNC